MPYSIIKLPFDLRLLRDKTKADLRSYRDWFHAIRPGRIEELARTVRDSPGFESWTPDHTRESLAPLGDWFCSQVATRPRTEEELAELSSYSKHPIPVPTEELTDRTFSLAMDVGMCFGEVVIRNLDGTEWGQPTRSKSFVDHGHPVIMGFGTVPLNPVRLVVTLGYGVAAKRQTGERLLALYDYWKGLRTP